MEKIFSMKTNPRHFLLFSTPVIQSYGHILKTGVNGEMCNEHILLMKEILTG